MSKFLAGQRVVHKSGVAGTVTAGDHENKGLQIVTLKPHFPGGVAVNVMWDEVVSDPERGQGRILSHEPSAIRLQTEAEKAAEDQKRKEAKR